MHFKDKSQLTDLWIELDDPNGDPMRIPKEGGAGSMAQLITWLDMEIRNLNDQGFNYLEPLQMQADLAKLSYRAFLGVVIENIICKRHPNPQEACFSDGTGDNLHMLSGKVDKIVANLPKPLGIVAKRLIQAATTVATGRPSQTMGGCETCGGTKTISPNISILGRAGKFNNYNK